VSKQIDPVAIVGGGFAGLTVAHELNKRDVPFTLYESSDHLAGLAKSFKDEEGFSYDFGTHLITNRLASEIGVEDQCRQVGYFGETVFLRGKTYRYPFGLMRYPHYVLGAVASRIRSLTSPPPNNADEFFRQMLGNALAEDVAIPLIESVMGAPASLLSASVGDKLPGVWRTVMLRLAGKITGKAVAIGYTQDQPETPRVWHTYPVGGIEMICSHLADGIHDRIHLASRVEKIIVERNRVTGIRVNGEFHPASAVISTAPVNVLPKILEGSDSLDYLARFRYQPAVFVNIRLKGRGLLPDVVLWTPESEFPFFRLQEAAISMPWLAPEGKTVITADIGCTINGRHWSMDDDELGKLCVQKLAPIIPDAENRYLGCRVLRTRIAYPVLLAEYQKDRERLQQGTGIDGLYSVGRNGEFDHIMMEDGYHRACRKARDVAKFLGT